MQRLRLRRMRWLLVGLAMGAGIAAAAATPGRQAGSPLQVTQAHVQPARAGQFETWAYAIIGNTGTADALVSVDSPDAASVVLRATNVTDAGRKTRSVASIPVPAGALVPLSADTAFIAFIQPRHAFVPGQIVRATLRFASGAQRIVHFLVDNAEGDPADGGP
jgi:copper(I)-binding protein